MRISDWSSDVCSSDLQAEPLQIECIPAPCTPQRAPAADAGAIERAAAMIAAAQRPVLYIAGGIAQARAQALALTFAERASVPPTTTLMPPGSVPTAHPLPLGSIAHLRSAGSEKSET